MRAPAIRLVMLLARAVNCTFVMAKKTERSPSCEICLYGNRDTGAGWIAAFAGRVTGDGVPQSRRSFTEAVWLGAAALRELGAAGSVAIYAPGGEKVSLAALDHVPSFGDLRWQLAQPAAVISVEAVMSAGALPEVLS